MSIAYHAEPYRSVLLTLLGVQIESFLHIYSHLTPPNELPAVTDLLVFLARIGRPGVWEEMRE